MTPPIFVLLFIYNFIYNTIENAANRIIGKPLCTPRYYNQPSHNTLHQLCWPLDFLWLDIKEIIMQHFLVVYHEIPHLSNTSDSQDIPCYAMHSKALQVYYSSETTSYTPARASHRFRYRFWQGNISFKKP